MQTPMDKMIGGLPRKLGFGIFAPLIAGALFSAMPTIDAQAMGNPDLSATPLAKSSANIVVVGKGRVVDGDTIVIEDGKGGKERIRLLGIDAPESKQTCKDKKGQEYSCGVESQQAMQKLVGNDPVRCIANKRDQYNRVLGVCYNDKSGLELNREMINEGEAIAYTAYSKAYTPVEKVAQDKQQGVWRGDFEKPWEYRKAKRLASRQASEVRDAVKDAKKMAKDAKAAAKAALEGEDYDFLDSPLD